ncbi:hypothetical protein SAMN05216327_1181 [Dyadobacter sp. SG02]|nr:hypothetical protein SAMN05216327_1181 [Dyadobacter sp. SG02]
MKAYILFRCLGLFVLILSIGFIQGAEMAFSGIVTTILFWGVGYIISPESNQEKNDREPNIPTRKNFTL